MSLTKEQLSKLFAYDPASGVFTRKVYASSNARVGDVVGTRQNAGGYSVVRICGADYYLHRLAWLYMTGEWPSGTVDHINGVRSDNRWENLRDVTLKVNNQNIRAAKAGSKSGVLGVCWSKTSKKWKSEICINGKNKHLGVFKTQDEAHAAYLDAKREQHAGCTL